MINEFSVQESKIFNTWVENIIKDIYMTSNAKMCNHATAVIFTVQ